FPNLDLQHCDGTDALESLEAMRRAVQYCRERKGPALIHANVIRPYSHSLSDDERLYRCEAERTADAKRDPVTRFSELLIAEGVIQEDELQQLQSAVDREVREATDQALASTQTDARRVKLYVK